MDVRGNIYEALSDLIPPEDKARLDGYLKARAEMDYKKHEAVKAELLTQVQNEVVDERA